MENTTKANFDDLDLSSNVLKAIKDMGFEEPSPIQASAIPHVLEGKDIIGQAQTGTGKTAAFAIPVVEMIDSSNKDLQAVILCPTRELVIQVANEFTKLMKYNKKLFVAPVYGGQPIERQLTALKRGCQVIVGTPGRTMDHIRRGSIDMTTVKMVVLDEADEMLDMGFREDIEVILKDTPDDKQSIMFSATMEQDILALTKTYLKSPTIVNVISKKQTPPKIQQVYFEVHNKNKSELLARLIDIHLIKLSLVFCNTKSQVDDLVEVLKSRGYFADALHGDMNQKQRDKVMKGFRDGTVEILVATDVAGRGIDVNNVEAVFNYDLPRDEEDYVHRIGRTGRAGKSGIAFSFVSGKQIYSIKRIERANGVQIQRQEVPTVDELELSKINNYVGQIKGILADGGLSNYVNHIEMMIEDEYTTLDIAAALLKIIIEKESESFDGSVNFDELEQIEQSKRRGGSRGRGPRGDGRREYSRDSKPGRTYDRKKSDRPYERKKSGDSYDKPKSDRPYDRKKSGDSYDKPKSDRPYDRKKSSDSYDKKKSDRPYDKKRSDRSFDKKDSFKKGSDSKNKGKRTKKSNAEGKDSF